MVTNERQAVRRRRHQPHSTLIALRINQGLSREALAYQCGVSRETIRQAEAGFLPSPRVQFAIAAVFDMRPLDLWPIARQRSGR